MKKNLTILFCSLFVLASVSADEMQAVIKGGKISVANKHIKGSLSAPAFKGASDAQGSFDLYYGSSLMYSVAVKGKDQKELTKAIMKIANFYKGKSVSWNQPVMVPPKKDNDPVKYKVNKHNIKLPGKPAVAMEGETSQVAFTFKTENKKKKVGASVIVTAPGTLDDKGNFTAAESADKVMVNIAPFMVMEEGN